MQTSGKFRVDPTCLAEAADSDLEVVVPYTGPETTAAALDRVSALTAGLNAHIVLIAVHTLPYPMPFVCPSRVHAFLVEELIELASRCQLAVEPRIVLARDRLEGFRYALKPASTVLVATRRHFWRTEEEKLAHSLARQGHKVALMHVAR